MVGALRQPLDDNGSPLRIACTERERTLQSIAATGARAAAEHEQATRFDRGYRAGREFAIGTKRVVASLSTGRELRRIAHDDVDSASTGRTFERLVRVELLELDGR